MPKIGYLIVLSDGPKYKLYLQRKKYGSFRSSDALERSLPARFTLTMKLTTITALASTSITKPNQKKA